MSIMSRHLDEDNLTCTLNALLEAISIPLTLSSPLELTPSLILAIFESMLRVRLPLPPETRKSSTYRARVDTMKIIIGVLADDILGVAGEVDSNLSLNTASTASTVLGGIISGTNDSSDGRDRKLKLSFGDLDPRNLAQGHKEEVTRVAEILCWLAKKMNYVSSDGKAVEKTALSLDASLREWCNSSSKHLEEQKQWMDRSDDDSVLDLNSQEMERSVLSSASASTEGYGSPLRHSVQSLRESRTTTSGIDEEVNSEYNIEMSSEFSHQFESMSFLQDGYEDLDPPMGASDNIIEIRDEDISLPPLSPRKVHSPAHLKSSFSGLDSDSSLSLEVARGKPSTTSLSYCHCEEELSDYSIITPALRTTGDINLVNFENEMTVYESWRERSRNQNFQCRTCSHSSDQSRGSQYQNNRKSSFSNPAYYTPYRPTSYESHDVLSTGIITRHNSPSQYTLALLNERARLLSDLSRRKHERTQT